MTRSRRQTQTEMVQVTLEAAQYLEPALPEPTTQAEIDPGDVCPACGRNHKNDDYSSLPEECQLLLQISDELDFKNLPTTPEPEPEPEEIKPEPEEIPYPV